MRSEPKRNIDRRPLSRKPPQEDPLAAALHKLATAKDGQEVWSAQEAIDAALPHWTRDSRTASTASPNLSPARIDQLVAAVYKGPTDPDALAAGERIRDLVAEAGRTVPVVTTDWDFTVGNLKPRWLIPDWIPVNNIGLLTSEGASGASLLALQMCARTAAGGGVWLGRRVGSAMPEVESSFAGVAVIAQWEDDAVGVRRSLDRIDEAEENIMPLPFAVRGRLHYVDMARYGPVWARSTDGYQAQAGLTATGRWLREHCENAGAKLLILAPLVNAFGASENANENVAHAIADWGDWVSYLT